MMYLYFRETGNMCLLNSESNFTVGSVKCSMFSLCSKVVIAGKEVEKVNSYKYVGTVIDDTLSWVENTNLVISKAQKRLYLLRKLKIYFEINK